MAGEIGKFASRLRQAPRYGFGVARSLLAVFAAGTVFYEMHSLFLTYHAREWLGLQASGVNTCAGESIIANGDLFSGATFCNHFLNYLPWLVLYKNHLDEVIAYYGVGILVIVSIGWLWVSWQHRAVNRARLHVEEQKALGRARHATPAETHAALTGKRPHASPAPRFPD
jgi:hypothetical protein